MSAPVAAPVPPPPPPLAGDRETVRSMLSLARTLALLFALLAGVLFLILLVLGIVEAIFGAVPADIGGAVYCLVSAVVNYLAWREIPRLESLAQQGQYRALRDQLLVWFILGLLFFVVVGVVLLVAWIRVDSLAASTAPAVPPAAPPASSGVCPRCGGPATWLPEYGRFYCYRCSAYL
jgi:xanthine/uracil/vitamin C permease (AzgA family)